MFSGIVEAKATIVRAEEVLRNTLTRVWVQRPASFDDLNLGDSVATDGVCLTVEAFDETTIQFALAAETLAVTNWRSPVSSPTDARGASGLVGRVVNLERSLRLGDRIHGHMVSGHVDAAARVARIEDIGDTRMVDVEIPNELRPLVWKKGSWALNGVSLTVNSVDDGIAAHCLIPETLLRTNLGQLRVGDLVNIEIDLFARSVSQMVEGYLLTKAQNVPAPKPAPKKETP